MLRCVNICACVRILNETQPLVPMASGRARDCACLTPLTEHRSTKPITQPTDVPQHRKDCATTSKEQYPPPSSPHTHAPTDTQTKQTGSSRLHWTFFRRLHVAANMVKKHLPMQKRWVFACAAFHMSIIEFFFPLPPWCSENEWNFVCSARHLKRDVTV